MSRALPTQSRFALADVAIWLGLICGILAIYGQSAAFDFTNYDDPLFVTGNLHMQKGLTASSVRWALTAVVANNWMPVTLLSHLLDVQLFGLESGMHHLVNVLFHIFSALLLLVSLQRSTGRRWPAAVVAFLFALHPLHVESVAWIAERKDVLSAFFFFLALYGYIRYTERPAVGRYLLVAVPFGLGLMSKPMLVTFPFLLLLLDVWPLRRTKWPPTFLEKLPLFALSVASSVGTYVVQRSSGAVREAIPFTLRAGNALVSYIVYIGQMFWPARLAVIYPYPRSVPSWQAVGAAAILLGLTLFVVRMRRTQPHLLVGWLWYVGTLVPVIGLVQVGEQAHADRYTYLPMVGLSVMLAWGGADLVDKWPRGRPILAAAAALSCAACLALASIQAAYWRDSETLFDHTLAVTRDNWVAEGSLGEYLMKMPGRGGEAMEHFRAALRIQPDSVESNNDLAVCLINAGLYQDAITHLKDALRIQPDFPDALTNLGVCLMNTGRDAEAANCFAASLRAWPDNANARFNLGLLLSRTPGREQEAIDQFEAGLRLNPQVALAQYNLGQLLLRMGRPAAALAHLEVALSMIPDPTLARTVRRLRAEIR